MAQFSTYYYEEGNAARVMETEALPTREDYERELREEKEFNRRVRIRNHRRQKLQTRRVTAFFAAGVVAIGVLFGSYVHMQNKITTSMNNISRLENQISELKTENAAAKSRIATAVNLNEIKNVAIKDLGMVYANSSQIVYYNVDDEDYMNQLEDIK